MADTTNKLTLDIQVGGNQDQALGSLKKQLREATYEVAKLSAQYGDTSKEAIEAAKRAGELKDQIGFATSLIDAFNPDAKFKALTSSLSGVAGGFAAVQGAIGLFGAESEAVEKTLLKVQSAMAISEGLQNVGESIDSFKQLGAVIQSTSVYQTAYNFVMGQKVAIQEADVATTTAATIATRAQAAATNTATVATTASTTAMKLFRAALLATGIGALVIGITLLVQNFDKLKAAVANTSFGKFISSVASTITAITDLVGITNAASRAEQQRQAIYTKAAAGTKIINEGIDRQIKLLQAQGAEQGKIDALKKQSIQNELNDLKKASNQKGILYGEQAKKYKDLQNELQVIDATSETARREAAKAAADKSAAASGKYGEDAKKKAEADAKERADAEKAALEKLGELRNAVFLSTFKDENEKKKAELNLAFIKEKDEVLANTKLTEETKNQLIIGLRTKLNTDIDAVNQAQKDKQAASDAQMLDEAAKKMATEDDLEFQKLQKGFAKTQDDEKKKAAKDLADIDKKIAKNTTDLELEKGLLDQKDAALEEAFANSLITEEQYNSGKESLSNARIEIDKKEAETKVQLLQMTSQALTQASEILGKETAAGKTLAVAGALINTYQGIAAGVKLGFPLAIPAVAMASMTGFSAVKNILAVKTPGGSGGSAGNMSTPSISAAAPIAPPQPQAATTNISNQSINAMGNQAIRSYVVESDVTNSQQRMAAIQQRARFG